MRSADKPATLNELIGSGHEKTESASHMEKLQELLGDRMPDCDYSRVGRIRLMGALEQRFGPNYRHLKQVKALLEEFDKHMSTKEVVEANLKARKAYGR